MLSSPAGDVPETSAVAGPPSSPSPSPGIPLALRTRRIAARRLFAYFASASSTAPSIAAASVPAVSATHRSSGSASVSAARATVAAISAAASSTSSARVTSTRGTRSASVFASSSPYRAHTASNGASAAPNASAASDTPETSAVALAAREKPSPAASYADAKKIQSVRRHPRAKLAPRAFTQSSPRRGHEFARLFRECGGGPHRLALETSRDGGRVVWKPLRESRRLRGGGRIRVRARGYGRRVVEGVPLTQERGHHAGLGVRGHEGGDAPGDFEDVSHLLGANGVVSGERGDELGSSERLDAALELLEFLRGVLELGDAAHNLETATHGGQDVGHVSNVAGGEDVVDAGDEFGESGGVSERLPGALHATLHLVDGREEANGLTGGALGVVETAKDALDAGLKAFGVVLDAIDLGDRAGDALQAREGLLLERQGDVLSEELKLHLNLGEVPVRVLGVRTSGKCGDDWRGGQEVTAEGTRVARDRRGGKRHGWQRKTISTRRAYPVHAVFTHALTSNPGSEKSASEMDISTSLRRASRRASARVALSPVKLEFHLREIRRVWGLSQAGLRRYQIKQQRGRAAKRRTRHCSPRARCPASRAFRARSLRRVGARDVARAGIVTRAFPPARASFRSPRASWTSSSSSAPGDASTRGVFAFAPRRASRARASSSDVSSVGDPTAVAGDADAVSSPSAGSAPDVDSLVRDVLLTIADTDSGRDITDAQRDATDANITALERIGAAQRPVALENPLIFGDYDVSYVSTGKKQIGNPAGGRFRGGLGAALFRTQGLEQNLYEPNVVVNRVAFLVLGLIPGEVVLNGTFVPLTAELVDENAAVVDEETKNRRAGDASRVTANELSGKGVDDGMTVRAFFDPPEITLGGLPTFRVGPKSSVVLSTTYLDDRVRLGKEAGVRSSSSLERRRNRRSAIVGDGAWAVSGSPSCYRARWRCWRLPFGDSARAARPAELTLATAAAVAVSLAMALVMRQGGIVAEDADYDDKYEAAAEKARAAAGEKARAAAAKGGEGTLG